VSGGPSGRPRLGLALGGGAARGIAHVGVFKVLEEAQIRPDVIVGTSAGALAGVFLAAGVSPARMAAWVENLRWSLIARPVVSRLGLTSNDRLGKLLERALPVRTFEELVIPFACIATDLETCEPVLICEGDLVSAIRASCAIPGLVVPVERDGRLLMDGGVVENVPTAVTRLFGVDVVVAVDVNRSYRRPAPPSNMLAIAMQAFFTIGRKAEQAAADHADVLIAPDVGDVGVDELSRAAELIDAGERAAREALPTLQALLERIESHDLGEADVPTIDEVVA
jgi:NTE family protein